MLSKEENELLTRVGPGTPMGELMRQYSIGLIGSPETVARLLREFAREGLFNTVLGELNFGFLTEEQVMGSIRLFGEEVIARLRDYQPY